MSKLAQFKTVMASFPSGVVVATTTDSQGEARGFTATAFTSVSVDPMLVLICLGRSANCFDAFSAASHFGISILSKTQEEVARLMATRGADKFASDVFEEGPNGLKFVRGAVATLVCRKSESYEGGDHDILVGEVEDIDVSEERDAMVFYRRSFLSPTDASAEALRQSRSHSSADR